jgi:hypothetical protein
VRLSRRLSGCVACPVATAQRLRPARAWASSHELVTARAISKACWWHSSASVRSPLTLCKKALMMFAERLRVSMVPSAHIPAPARGKWSFQTKAARGWLGGRGIGSEDTGEKARSTVLPELAGIRCDPDDPRRGDLGQWRREITLHGKCRKTRTVNRPRRRPRRVHRRFVLRWFEQFKSAEARTWWAGGTCRLVTAHPDTPGDLPSGIDLATPSARHQLLEQPHDLRLSPAACLQAIGGTA